MNINLIKPIGDIVTTAVGLFKDTKGKLSSKRTISGVIVITASTDIAQHGITTQNLILTFLGILPVILSIFECQKESV